MTTLASSVLSKQEGVQKQQNDLVRHRSNLKVVQQTTCDQIEACFQVDVS